MVPWGEGEGLGPALPDTRPKDLSGREGRGQHAWGSHKLDGTGMRACGGVLPVPPGWPWA